MDSMVRRITVEVTALAQMLQFNLVLAVEHQD
jgi:hypothetical protein